MLGVISSESQLQNWCRDLLAEFNRQNLWPADTGLLQAELERILAQLAGSTPDRDEMLQTILRACFELQENHSHRSAFLARAEYDFQSPLTAVSGYCGLLLEGSIGSLSPQQASVVARIQHNAHRLGRMGAAMVDLNFADGFKDRLIVRAASLENCIDQAIQETRPECDARDISVEARLRDIPSTLPFDAEQVTNLIIYLLDNASRFSPRHGLIEITGFPFFWERRTNSVPEPRIERRSHASLAPNSFRVDIRDSGPPVPGSLLPFVFDECSPHSNRNDRSGAGLGLAICRLIAHAHGGQVWVRSASDGVVFSFALPLVSDLTVLPAAQPGLPPTAQARRED